MTYNIVGWQESRWPGRQAAVTLHKRAEAQHGRQLLSGGGSTSQTLQSIVEEELFTIMLLAYKSCSSYLYMLPPYKSSSCQLHVPSDAGASGQGWRPPTQSPSSASSYGSIVLPPASWPASWTTGPEAGPTGQPGRSSPRGPPAVGRAWAGCIPPPQAASSPPTPPQAAQSLSPLQQRSRRRCSREGDMSEGDRCCGRALRRRGGYDRCSTHGPAREERVKAAM